jgi:hypothetical protein
VKVDDEQSDTHVYAGKPGASYHLFYTGQPTNNEIICGVKRIGYAFSLDGVHWVKWNDPNTAEPFQDSDPVVSWTEYGQTGFTGVGAATAVLVGDEVRIYYSMYEERLDVGRPPEGPVGTAFATVKVDTLRKIAADAKAKGLLTCASRQEIDAVLDDPLPQSMWDDLQGSALAAIQAKQAGNTDRERSAMTEIAATRGKFTKALERHYQGPFAPLKAVVEALENGQSVTEKAIWRLPADRMGQNPPQIELAGLNVPTGDHPLMIEIEAKCNRFELGRVAWATGDGFQPGHECEFMAGYPGVEFPTYRVTIAPGGSAITALRLQFPAGAAVDLRQVGIRELAIQPTAIQASQP